MAQNADNRLSSVIVGGIFLGLMMFMFGFLPQQGTNQPVPIWVWRILGYGGLVLMSTSIPAGVIRREWTRVFAMIGWGLTVAPFGVLLVHSAMVKHFTPFELLLGCGVLACGKSIRFYNLQEIRECFNEPSLPPPESSQPPSAGPTPEK